MRPTYSALLFSVRLGDSYRFSGKRPFRRGVGSWRWRSDLLARSCEYWNGVRHSTCGGYNLASVLVRGLERDDIHGMPWATHERVDAKLNKCQHADFLQGTGANSHEALLRFRGR